MRTRWLKFLHISKWRIITTPSISYGRWKNTSMSIKKRILHRKNLRNCAGITPSGSGRNVTDKPLFRPLIRPDTA
jgi:hypothetical protein